MKTVVLTPENMLETYIYYDGPLFYSFECEGKIYLKYTTFLSSSVPYECHWIVGETTFEILEDLKNNKISMVEALKRSVKLYLQVESQDGVWNQETPFEDISPQLYPATDVFLDLEENLPESQ